MVDWKQLADKWSELSKETQDKITAAMRKKYEENADKFIEWLKEDPGRQTIWLNYAALVPPKFKVGDYVDVGPVYPPTRPGMGGLYESIVKVIDVIPQAPPAIDKYAYTVEDTHGQTMTYLESAIKPAAPAEKPPEKPPRFKVEDWVKAGALGTVQIKEIKRTTPPLKEGWLYRVLKEGVLYDQTEDQLEPVEKPPIEKPPVEGPRFKPGDKVVDRKTGDEYTVKDTSKWPSILLTDRYGNLTARDEYQLVTSEEYEALKEEEKRKREKPKAPPIPGAPSRGLSTEDISRLHDLWNNEFFRALGKVPTSTASTFRVEVEKLKDKTFDEAKETLLDIAKDIIATLIATKAVRAAPPRRVREYRPPPERPPIEAGVRVPPAQFPSYPLSYDLPFPRGPTSKEQIRIWQAFLYQMQQQGYDGTVYQREFDEYIGGTQFLSWEDMKKKYDLFVSTIMSGLELPPLEQWRGIPIPTGLKGLIQEKPELEKLEDLIVHYSSVVIRNARSRGEIPTLEDLREELATHAIIPADTPLKELRDATKTAITRAVERKDVWVSGITTTEINDFLASE